MTPDLEQRFITHSAEMLEKYTSRIRDCLGKLTPDQIWTRNSSNQNAIGNLVLHLCGNVRQWIGTGVGGAPNTRDRDSEFAAQGGLSAQELGDRLAQVVGDAAARIRSVSSAELHEMTEVQNYKLTKFEAIYHVVEHFSGHTGQIMFATKLLTGEDLGYYRHLASATAAPNPTNTP